MRFLQEGTMIAGYCASSTESFDQSLKKIQKSCSNLVFFFAWCDRKKEKNRSAKKKRSANLIFIVKLANWKIVFAE